MLLQLQNLNLIGISELEKKIKNYFYFFQDFKGLKNKKEMIEQYATECLKKLMDAEKLKKQEDAGYI